MSFQEKHPSLNSKTQERVAGIPVLVGPLKRIYTKAEERTWEDDEDEKECCTTPTGHEYLRVDKTLTCPPAPRKQKPSLKFSFGATDFFRPPELETVFIRHVKRAN